MSTARTRLRFDRLQSETTSNGHCSAAVSLEWYGHHHKGSAVGLATPQGRIKASAEAAVRAVTAAAGRGMHLELLGVKAVRAFDGWVVVARLVGEEMHRNHRLIGSAACEREEELGPTAVRAVLNAVNRILETVMRADA
ncbi:MAG: hypothetical protein OEZ65_01100 [Gemmatimonadota bacterium]|nr:hypothetical protein [Gemmatimonadota bacterium]